MGAVGDTAADMAAPITWAAHSTAAATTAAATTVAVTAAACIEAARTAELATAAAITAASADRCRWYSGSAAPTATEAGSLVASLGELVLRRLRIGRVEDALLDAVLEKNVVDLRQGGIERIRDEFAGVAAQRAPVRGRGGVPEERVDLDGP